MVIDDLLLYYCFKRNNRNKDYLNPIHCNSHSVLEDEHTQNQWFLFFCIIRHIHRFLLKLFMLGDSWNSIH